MQNLQTCQTSPKRENIAGEYQSTTLDKLNPAKWTLCVGCYRKKATLYDALFPFWDHCLWTGELDRVTMFRVGGVKAKMTTFLFIFRLQLDYKLYGITDNLSKAL